MRMFLIVVLGITYWEYAQYAIAFIASLYSIRMVVRICRYILRIITNLRLSDADTMDGLEFEKYIANTLKKQGYSIMTLTEQYGYGVDIIANKVSVRWGIQVKRYSGLVKAEAVRQVVAGLRVYGCDRAMVITNSVFSKFALSLAKSNRCVLLDRNDLLRMAK